MKFECYLVTFKVKEEEEEILNYKLFQLKTLGTENRNLENLVEVKAYFSTYLSPEFLKTHTGFSPERVERFNFCSPESSFIPFFLEDAVIYGGKMRFYSTLKNLKRIKISSTTAFGTGKHPSTALSIRCLRWLREMKPSLSPILDIGTGTGILSIYGVLSGWDRAVAVDCDYLACVTAKRNVIANRLSKKIKIVCSRTYAIRGNFPLVVANLTLEDHMSLMEEYRRLTSAYLVLSGIYENVQVLTQALENLNFKIIKKFSEDEWWAIIAKKYTGSGIRD